MPLINKPAVGPFTRTERVIITIPVLSASLLHAVNMTTAYVALPNIQGNLSATPSQVGWVITAFVVASAIGTIITGWLSNQFGRRRIFITSIIGFTLTALLCATATGLNELVVYRFLQGFVSAPLLPISQAIMLDTYPRERHGFAMSIWSMGMILGPVLGPTVGAALTEWYNWRYVFMINVPLGLIALAGIWAILPEAERQTKRLDWIGVLALTFSVCALQLMLDRGERLDWFESWEIILYAVLCVTAGYIFVVHCLTARAPFLPIALLRNRNYTVGLVVVLVFGMLNFTPMTLLPPLMQNLGGHPDSVIGFLLGARGLGTLAGFFLMFFAAKWEPRMLMGAGFMAQAIAGWWMAQMDLNLDTDSLFWAIFLQGFGVGILWVPISTVAFATLPAALVPDGTAFFHLLRNIGSSIHISLSITLVIRSAKASYAGLTEYVSPFNESWTLPWVSGGWSQDSTQALLAVSGEVGRQAAMIGYINSFYFFAITALVVLPLIVLVRR